MTPLLSEISQLWADILAVESVGPDDNFFKLGGDSLMATILMANIEERYEVVLDPVEVFNAPTLREFAWVMSRVLPRSPSDDDEEYEEGVL